MSSVDDRIVRMQFDNGQFNKGVESTTKALSGLESSLKLDGMANNIDSIASKFSVMGVIGATAINRLSTAAINTGVKMASSLVDPIVEGGKKRALNIEQAKFQLSGLGQDVRTIMDDVNYAVDGTAYGLDEAAMAASQLAASQVSAGDDMKASLRGISGVAAMTGSSYSDIASVFTKVAGQGRVMGDDLLRLSARGMNAAATMAKAMGISEAEVRDMATKGQISFKMFADAMNDAFGEQATKANETFKGAASNFRASLARLGQQYFLGTDMFNANGYFERQRKKLVAITPLINQFGKALKPVMTKYNELASIKTDNMVSWIDKIADSGIIENLSVVGDEIANTMQNIFDGITSVLKPITTRLSKT